MFEFEHECADALEKAEAALAAAVAKEREACLAIISAFKVSVGNSRAGEIAAHMTMDALRELREEIQARADQPEYTTDALDEVLRDAGEA
jgi:hypothetical protein